MTAPRQHPGHTNAPAVPTSEVLLAAARLMETHGWRQGDGWPTDLSVSQPLCLEGAIMAALGLTMDDAFSTDDSEDWFRACPAYSAVMDYLADDDRWALFRQRAYDWNDVPSRTADEVVEVLHAAALIEAAREQAEVGASGVAAEAAVV